MVNVVHVVTNVSHYEGKYADEPTGLWLTELTHAWDVFAKHGYSQRIISPSGGESPLEPKSLKWPNQDDSGKAWLGDDARMALLKTTGAPDSVNPADVDILYFTGGHGVMFDFTDSAPLAALTAAVWEAGGIVASVCHGYCALLNVKTGGEYLINGKKLTGFSWCEEELAGVAKKVPYNAEQVAKDHGAKYEKGWVPFTSKAVADGRLVTGQNPGSAKETAQLVVRVLEGKEK